MLKIINKYTMTLLSFTIFIHTIIVDYSKYQNTHLWVPAILYKIFFLFGIIPINTLFMFLTIIIYISEKNNVKSNNSGFRTLGVLVAILIIIIDMNII